MKSVAKLVAILGLVVGFTAHAADGSRKTAVLDGKYLRIVASAPDFANEGTDARNKKGVGKGTANGLIEQFVHFNASLAEDSTIAVYSVRMTESEAGKPVPDAKWHAEYLIKSGGLDPAKAMQIESPSLPFADATVVALRAEGVSFDDPKQGKEVIYAIGVSFPGMRVAYGMSGLVLTSVSTFDADPAKADKRARSVLGNIWKNSTITRK